jgi:transcriptional regulator with XRE-family HTH domain
MPRHPNPRVSGARLRAIRHERGMYVKTAAAGIGIAPSYLSLIELGSRPAVSPIIFNRILRFYGVDRAEISPESVEVAA